MNQTQFNNCMNLCKELRSGRLRQTTGRLKEFDNSYCCLGVACEISGLGKFDNDLHFLGQALNLPYEVQEFYGFPEKYGFKFGGVELTLLNDGYYPTNKELRERGISVHSQLEYSPVRLTFPQIADVIEYWATNELNNSNSQPPAPAPAVPVDSL